MIRAALAISFFTMILIVANALMHAPVAGRSREIATLRALGFQAFPVAVSVMAEALALSLLGTLIGAGLALVVIRNMAFTVYDAAANANIALHFAPGVQVVIDAMAYVLLLGLASSVLPCIRALRGPIPAGLLAR